MVVTGKFGADVNTTNGILNAFARAVITRSPSSLQKAPLSKKQCASTHNWVEAKKLWYSAAFAPVHSATTMWRSFVAISSVFGLSVEDLKISCTWALLFSASWSMLNATDEKRQSPSPSIGCRVRRHEARLLSNLLWCSASCPGIADVPNSIKIVSVLVCRKGNVLMFVWAILVLPSSWAWIFIQRLALSSIVLVRRMSTRQSLTPWCHLLQCCPRPVVDMSAEI